MGLRQDRAGIHQRCGRANAYRAHLSVIRGDVNNDGLIDALDLSVLIDMVFYGAHATLDDRTANFDCSEFVDSTDLAMMIDYVHFGGDGPPICFKY